MIKIGQALDNKYTILTEIGRGGMSTVYLAMDMRLNKQWVVKEIRKSGVTRKDEIVVNSLLAEANLMKRLDHPALPRIVDIIDDGDTIHIVMDYIEGESLDKILSFRGVLEEIEVTGWVEQIADALSYLHTQDPPIIYRDVKPANLILTPTGRIKIIDFGIAREYKPKNLADTTVLGTKGYAPPEQYSGQTTPLSDIYALGVTMHQLLTGIDPHSALPYRPVRHWNPKLSEEIEAIVDKCVQPAPENRFQSCAELIHALNNPKHVVREYRRNNGGSLSLKNLLGKKRGMMQAAKEEISCERLNELTESLPKISNVEDVEILRGHLSLSGSEGLDRFNWAKLEHLHILCSPDSSELLNLWAYNITRGGYHNRAGTWMLLVGIDKYQISRYIRACREHLKTLHIRLTDIRTLDLAHLKGLKTLHLTDNPHLELLDIASRMEKLEVLNLANNPITSPLYLDHCTNLLRLDISHTRIKDITTTDGLIRLTNFNAADSSLEDVTFIKNSPELSTLDLSNCPVYHLPPMNDLRHLKFLSLSATNISVLPKMDKLEQLEKLDCSRGILKYIEDTALPNNLLDLNLSNTLVTRIPEQIRSMPRLNYLDLSGMKLEELPDWLPEIANEFTTEARFNLLWSAHSTDLLDVYKTEELVPSRRRWCVVNLKDTQVEGIDMSVFSQPMSMILQWFESRKRPEEPLLEDETVLNEVKVVFLGDGEAGKSLAVARLLNDGAHPASFDGNATPGIAIKDLQYELDGRKIQVHFWDFGGQEILHSMHRMFLTQRTLYVILLNARDDTQDDRARYWLHNVKSFADGAPVILAINKIDQNRKASVNESDLRMMYPGLTEVIRMSALLDSQEEFNSTFTAALKRQLGQFETLESPFLPEWNRLKNRLRNMTESYILSPDYMKLSEECGVSSDTETRTALLNWFTDLGVSFCYSGSAKLEDYVILRPDWITNAVYILMYNPIAGLKNGIVSHDAIYRMLHPTADRRAEIKCVLPDVTYSNQDTEYVLNVIRRFRLSYLLQDNVEFIPMLCLRDAMSVAEDYAADPKTLEFRMIYEYLPNNVIHRLMVDMHRDLDIENVWLTGSRFQQNSTGLSAVVKAEANVLRLFVRSTDLRYPADYYLDVLKDIIERISDEMGLRITERQIAYKDDGITECFDYDELTGLQRLGQMACYSKQRKRLIQIEKILRQSDHNVDKDRQDLIGSIIRACGQMQANSLYWGTNENTRNTFVRDSLINAGYQIADQSLSGISAGGKQSGELDILIRKKSGIPWTIYEGLILNGAGGTQIKYWDEHLYRLLDNYNENGLQFLVLVSYVTCSKDRFPEICKLYTDHIRTFSPGKYTFQSMSPADLDPEKCEIPHYLQAIRSTYDCGGFQTNVYHLFVRMNQKQP